MSINTKNINRKSLLVLFYSLLVLIFPISIIPILIYLFKIKTDIKLILFITVITLTSVALRVNPNESYDLYRHYDIIIKIREWNTDVLESFSVGYPYTYVNTFICYLVAQTSYNSLYPAFFIFTGYSMMFYIVIKEYDFTKNKYFPYIYILSFSFYRYFLYSIRNAYVFIFCYFICYLYENKKINAFNFILLNILSLFFHPAGAIVVFFYILFKMNIKTKIIILISILMLITGIGLNLLLTVFPDIKMLYIFEKISYYLNNNISFNLNYFVLYLLILMFNSVLIFKSNKKIKVLSIFSFVLCLSFVNNFDLLRRFIYLQIICTLPLLDSINNLNLKQQKFLKVLMILIIIIIIAGDIAGIIAYGF